MPRGISRRELTDLPDEVRYLAHIASGKNPGWIYFLACSQLELVKIGASNRWEGHQAAVDRRIREVKLDVPMIPIDKEAVILAASLGRNEAELHAHFAEYRIAGEWFVYCDDLKALVDSVARLQEEFARMESDPDAPSPKETPWKLLDTPARPPSKKFAGLRAEFTPNPAPA